MNTKQGSKKNKKLEIRLSSDERHELEILLDRLKVQDPDGQSLQTYLQSLRSALAGRDKLIAVLLEKLSKHPSPVGFKVFSVLADVITEKDFKRVAKQAGYRFSQKGYMNDPIRPAASQVVLIPKEAKQSVTHLIPAPDVDWFVAGFFPGQTGAEPVAISAYTENQFSQLSVRVVESSQKLYKDFIQKLADHLPDHIPYEVPAWHAARIYFEMLQFHGEKPIPSEAQHIKKILKPFYDPDKKPYACDLFPVLDQMEVRLTEQVALELFENMSFASVLLPKEDLVPYFEKLQQVERSVLVVRQEIQQERAMQLLQSAADELVVGERRFFYQRIFEELAVSLKYSKKTDLAQNAWIVAQHLAGSARVGENSVMTEVVALSIRSHWPDEFVAEEQEDNPYEKTESGLIIPR